MNHGVQANRVLKASRFVEFLDRHLPESANAFDLGNLLTEHWAQITMWLNDEREQMARDQEKASDLPAGSIAWKRETVPSIDTRSAIIAVYMFRETRGNVFNLFEKA